MRRLSQALGALGLLAAFAMLGAQPDSKPPDDLVRLERQVGLRAAHVRDSGPIDPAERELLSEAEQNDLKGEAALKAGDYPSARQYFNRAMELLGKLND